jgi:hypothetical protein
MDLQPLEGRLYQRETEELDFKAEQYLFEGAPEEQEGELLKDILAFTNTWRQANAYVLIGVDEARGGRSAGITSQSHLLSRDLGVEVL